MSYAYTVVGVFDSDFNAQDTVDVLISNGFARKDIDINNLRDVNGPSITDHPEVGHHHDHHTDIHKNETAITRFFRNIFGDDEEDADKHSRLAIEGGAVITIHTENEEQAGKAADILDKGGAVDVDERTAQPGSGIDLNSDQRSKSRVVAWRGGTSPKIHEETKGETE
ncbi:hypothetical protein BH10BAC3_BH10BAC3_30620 [soil metagenome]